MARKNVFISHAVKDGRIADAVAGLLERATSIESEGLISFPLDEAGIPAGQDLISYIRSKVGNPTTVIALLTPNYLTSRFCLCELGAVWAMSGNMIPLLVPPLTVKHVRDILPTTRVLSITDMDDLNRFVALLQEQLDLDNLNLPRWAVEKKRFIDTIKSMAN